MSSPHPSTAAAGWPPKFQAAPALPSRLTFPSTIRASAEHLAYSPWACFSRRPALGRSDRLPHTRDLFLARCLRDRSAFVLLGAAAAKTAAQSYPTAAHHPIISALHADGPVIQRPSDLHFAGTVQRSLPCPEPHGVLFIWSGAALPEGMTAIPHARCCSSVQIRYHKACVQNSFLHCKLHAMATA